MNISNFTVAFHTGMHFCFFNYDMLQDKTQNLNYGAHAKKNTSPEQKLGRPRSMSIFEELILTLMRLRLGLFQKDLVHI